ncbi:Unknown protein, partial [Striga hermonthica]
NHPNFAFLCETRKSKNFINTVYRNLGVENRWVVSDPINKGKGLLVFWNNEVVIHQILCNPFCIEVEFSLSSNNEKSWFIFVYLSPCRRTRIEQWQYLNHAKVNWGSKWVIAGDWNDILCQGEKNGERWRPEESFWGFIKCLADLGAQEIYMEGYPFTWGNNRVSEGYIEEKLDRMVASLHWLESHLYAKVLNIFKNHRKRIFCFDKRWLKKSGIKEEIQRAWNQTSYGSPMYNITERIKATRVALLKWSRSFKTATAKDIERLTTEMAGLREQGGKRNWERWSILKKQLDEAYKSEELFWKQKFRVLWLKEGDKNTKFFHAFTLQRRKQNAISGLVKEDQTVCTTREDITDCLTGFYQSLFTTEGSVDVGNILSYIPSTITEEQNDTLVAQVTEEEIKSALFNMHPDKAPRWDGMT